MTTTFDRPAIARAAYAAGATTREIADSLGVSPTMVSRWVGPDALRRTGPRGRADVRDARIVELRDAGMSFAEIGRRVGMSKSGVTHRYRIATEGARRDRV